MERMCFTFDIYEGKEAEYKKRHDEIWPELVADIKAAGFKNYTLFRRGLTIVGYFEVDGKVEDVFAKMGSSEANAKWSKWFEDVIVNLADGNGNLMSMKEVWHLD
jgi:L-rhamnose mutarotase